MNGLLLASSLALVAGGLMIAHGLLASARPPLALRLARLERRPDVKAHLDAGAWLVERTLAVRLREHYERELRTASTSGASMPI